MSEQLIKDEEPDSRRGYWQRIADLADEGVEALDIEISEMDGSGVLRGTINPADVKRTLEDPGYQDMMRRAAAHARELRADSTNYA